MLHWHKKKTCKRLSCTIFFLRTLKLLISILLSHVLLILFSLSEVLPVGAGSSQILKNSTRCESKLLAPHWITSMKGIIVCFSIYCSLVEKISKFVLVFKIQKGKLHGSLDISMAVMSVNKKSKRIDLDAGDNLYHLKVLKHL